MGMADGKVKEPIRTRELAPGAGTAGAAGMAG